jgi:hypothetical protein
MLCDPSGINRHIDKQIIIFQLIEIYFYIMVTKHIIKILLQLLSSQEYFLIADKTLKYKHL